MLPDLTLLVALVLGLFSLGAPGAEVDVDPWKAVGGTAAVVVVVAALCRIGADRTARALEDKDAETAVSAGKWLGLYPFLGWTTCLFLFDWGTFVGATVPRSWLLVPHVVLFLPLAVMVGAAWGAMRRVEATFDARAPTFLGAIRRGLRRNALVLVPLAALLAIQEAFVALEAWKVPGFRTVFLWHEAFPDFEAVVILGLLTLLAYFAPAVFRRVMKATPIEDGETRRDMQRMCDAIGVRCKDFLLWKTDGRVVNAMVVGLTGGSRYVFVTDGLLRALPHAELLAVVAHEAGHAKLRHLPSYFLLSMATMLLMRTAEEWVLPALPDGADLLLSLLFLAFFWFGMLGWLSRRFERQADVFAADHAGVLAPQAPPETVPGLPTAVPYGAAKMISALQRIVLQTGSGRHHRHGAPAARMAYLAAYATRPEVRRAQQADTRRLRLGLLAFGLVALATTGARLPGGLVRGRANLLLEEGMQAADDGRAASRRGDAVAARAAEDRARERFLDAAARLHERPDDPRLQAVAAVGRFNAADLDIHRLGRPEDARRGFEEALRLLAPLKGPKAGELAFQARIDLGRLALREGPTPEEAVARARRYLAQASSVPEEAYGGRYRSARQRLLESAIRLRDPDPAVAAQARADLARQAVAAEDSDPWVELASDAAEELRLAPR